MAHLTYLTTSPYPLPSPLYNVESVCWKGPAWCNIVWWGERGLGGGGGGGYASEKDPLCSSLNKGRWQKQQIFKVHWIILTRIMRSKREFFITAMTIVAIMKVSDVIFQNITPAATASNDFYQKLFFLPRLPNLTPISRPWSPSSIHLTSHWVSSTS